MCRSVVYALLVCLLAYPARAQNVCSLYLDIRLQEKHTLEPVSPAVVYIDELQKSFQADENGEVHMDGLCAGSYTCHVEAAGHVGLSQTIAVKENTRISLKMAHSLKEVTIKEDRVKTVLQSKESLDKQQLAAASGKSIGDVLQAVNGVTLLSNGGTVSKPVIHGLHSNRILMVNNGIRQEDQQWGSEHAPNIDPFLANRITVIKGAAGVRYGTDAIGGVVLVEPAPLRTTGWGGEVNLAGFSNNRMGVAEGMIEHGFKNIPGLAFRLQGTLKQGGNYRIPGYYVANTGVKESDYSAAVAYRKAHQSIELFYSHFNTDLGIYRGSHTGSKDDLLNAIKSDTPLVSAGFTYDIGRPCQHVVHDLAKVKLNAENKLGKWSLVYAFQHNFRQEYDVVRKDDGKAQLNLTLNTQTLNLNLDHVNWKGLTGEIGVDGIYQTNRFPAGDRLFIPWYNTVGGGLYLIERWKKNDWTVEGGLRYDYRWYNVWNNEGSNQAVVEYQYAYSSVSGTLGVNKKVNDKLDWSATLSNAWRAPQANELFSAGLHQEAARIELGNKDLRPERSYGLNMEGKWQATSKLSAELSLYSQYINNYIYLEPGPDLLTIRGYFKTFNYKQTNAWLNGTDLSAKYQWTDGLETSVKASFLLARNVTAKDWLILMPADRLSFNTRYTRSLSNTLKDCFAEIGGKYVFQQHRIPGNFDDIDYPGPPANYFLLNASAGTTLYVHKQPLYLSLAVENALNTRYRDYMDAFRYFIDQPGRNVALRIRVPFETKGKTSSTN